MAFFISQVARRTGIRDRTSTLSVFGYLSLKHLVSSEILFSSESLKCKLSNSGENTPQEFVQFENYSVNTHFAKYPK